MSKTSIVPQQLEKSNTVETFKHGLLANIL